MARPKHLVTKGEFNVIKVHENYWQLRFKNRVIVCGSNNRLALYRIRTQYSYWFGVINRLQHLLLED